MTQEDHNKDQVTQVAEEPRVSPATTHGEKDAQPAAPVARRMPARAAALVACAIAVVAALGGVGYAAGWFSPSVDPSASAAATAEQDSAAQGQEASDQQDASSEEAAPSEDSPDQGDDSGQAATDGSQSTAGGETGAAASGTSAAAPFAPAPSGSADAGSSQGGSGSAPVPSAPATPVEPAPKPATIAVSVTIDSSRAQAYSSSWPASMGSATVTLSEGATVYDALCAMGVSIGGSSYYVSSINGLAEKACGATSGWTYSVNGVFPNRACGRYVLSGGESVRWVYSTDADPTISM